MLRAIRHASSRHKKEMSPNPGPDCWGSFQLRQRETAGQEQNQEPIKVDAALMPLGSRAAALAAWRCWMRSAALHRAV